MTRQPLSIALLIALLFPGCSSEKTLPGSGQSEQTEQTSTDTGSVDDASDTTDTTDSGSPDEGAQAHSLEAALLPAVTKAIEAGMPGVIVYARVGEEEISIAQGKADIEADVPMRPDHMFRIASNSKTYLATVAAQLHSAGTFSLDTPIQDILSGDEIDAIENADVVTTRQLLNHTSGIYDYFESDDIWDAMLDDPTRQWTAIEALAYARNVPAAFAPGAEFGYSNTNYLLAGLVVDTVTGVHHSTAIQRDVLDAASLNESYYEAHGTPLGELSHGYGDYQGDDAPDDSFAFNHGYGLADGGMVTTVRDLAKFYDALNDGTLLDEGAKSAMFDNGVSDGYGMAGLGIFIETADDEDMWLHGGAVVGYLSDILYYPGTGDVLVFFANGSEGNLDGVYDIMWEELATAFDNY